MRQFLRSILILWPMTASLIFAAVLVGRANPQPDHFRALGFDLCNGQLCFLGITPGVTRWDDAVAILEKHGARRTGPVGIFYTDQLSVSLIDDSETQIIQYMGVMNRAGDSLPLTAGDVVNHLGGPCVVRPDFLIYPQRSVRLRWARQWLNAFTPIELVTLAQAGLECGSGMRWQGFASRGRYTKYYTNVPLGPGD